MAPVALVVVVEEEASPDSIVTLLTQEKEKEGDVLE